MAIQKRRKAVRKESFIKIRVTDEQKEAFESASSHEGMDLSTFARVAMIEKTRRAGIEI